MAEKPFEMPLGASKSIRCSGLSSGLLDRLLGVARQTGIHLTELRQLGNIGFISYSGGDRSARTELAIRRRPQKGRQNYGQSNP